MGVRIHNLETQIVIHDEVAKNIVYVSKSELLPISASKGNIVIAKEREIILNANPEEIILPEENGLYDLVQVLNSYLEGSPSGVFSGGWADYNDFATTGTPITITGGAGNTVLTNDGLGVNTNTTKLPFGVPKLWDSSTNKIDFTGLSIGDWVDIRIVVDVIVATNNTEVEGVLSFGSGGAAFTVPLIPTMNYKTTGTYSLPAYMGFYIGSQNMLENGAQILMSSDTTCTVTVHGWAIKAIKIG